MECPKCGGNNLNAAAFCRNCGKKLEMSYPVGIDLGTTNSVISVCRRGTVETLKIDGAETMASVVAFRDRRTMLVGADALNTARIHPDQAVLSVKRKIGDRKFTYEIFGKAMTPVEITSHILEKLCEGHDEGLSGEKVDTAVITVPAYFTEEQRKATKEAGDLAGLKVLRLLPEPTAAAIAYGLDRESVDQTILVYDLGGGTFDVSILRIKKDGRAGDLDVLAVHGNHDLGGNDFDEALSDYFLQEFAKKTRCKLSSNDTSEEARTALQRLTTEARRVKEFLSEAETAEIDLPDLFQGKHLQAEIDRKTFEGMIEPRIVETKDLVIQTVKDAELDIDDIDSVVLVGGSTRIPLVRNMVAETIKEPYQAKNADLAVSHGAALVAANMSVLDDAVSRDDEELPPTPFVRENDGMAIDRAQVDLDKARHVGDDSDPIGNTSNDTPSQRRRRVLDEDGKAQEDAEHAGLAGATMDGGKYRFTDRYQVRSLAGKGSSARVLMAQDTKLERWVALKLPKEGGAGLTEGEIREARKIQATLEREAMYLASLNHPNIVPLYEYYDADPGPLLVMRYVEDTLPELLRPSRSKEGWPVEMVARQLAAALDYCAHQGVAHRDVKPSNILVDASHNAYLTDFGLAARFDEAQEWATPLGTAAHVSPEFLQVSLNDDGPGKGDEERGNGRWERCDQFAFGVLLYQLLTGLLPYDTTPADREGARPPHGDDTYIDDTVFDDTGTQERLMRLMLGSTAFRLVRGEPIVPCHERNSDVPASVNRVIEKMLSVSPDKRYPTNTAAVEDLAECLAGRSPRDVQLFVSYHRETDGAFVRELISCLDMAEFSVWWDAKIEHGQYWDDEIEEAMLASDAMVVVMSPGSVQSNEPRNEWKYWLEHIGSPDNRKPLIPVMYEECRPPYRLAPIQRVDVRRSNGESKSVAEVAEELSRSVKRSVEKWYAIDAEKRKRTSEDSTTIDEGAVGDGIASSGLTAQDIEKYLHVDPDMTLKLKETIPARATDAARDTDVLLQYLRSSYDLGSLASLLKKELGLVRERAGLPAPDGM